MAVKVDREERPDVDAVYMAAVTALTGHGGWPMTCLLTPDGDPFFAGTYLPKPQLLALLANAGEVWTDQRDRVLASGASVAEQLRLHTGPPVPSRLDAGVCDTAVGRLRSMYDDARGGFGGAPKFPPSMVLEFLLRHHARTGSADALAMARGTCDAMARGGMYDQLGGGFARYSVDAGWVVPHFEKMLYDNALLLRVYAHLWRTTGDPLARRVAEETADFLLRDLRTAEGGFASALDADTVVDGHSHEGLTYAWTPGQLVDVLGPDDGRRAAALLAVTAAGTFEAGASTLQLRADPDDPAWWASARERLFAARSTRPQPSRDDKVVTAWNGLGGRRACRCRRAARSAPTSSLRRRPRPPSCSTCTSSTAPCGAPPAVGWSARPPGCSTTTATSPRGCSRCTRRPEHPAGRMPRHGCSTRRWSGSSTSTAPCTTPPTTPTRSSHARPGAPTTPSPRVRRRSPGRW